MEKPYITFYGDNGISPLSQDIGDRARHFRRRASLYRHLGMAPGMVRGRTVIEFGPGSGHNAVYTRHLKPARYVLVDGNETGLIRAKQLLDDGSANLEFHHCLMEDYRDSRMFDIVLCEGFLCFRDNAPALIEKAISLNSPDGGIVVTTCMDAVSILSDAVRRVIGQAVVSRETPLGEQIEIMSILLGKHMKNLPGLTRPLGDWLLDNVIHPYVDHRLLSIPDAVRLMGERYHVYGSSPAFMTDWRWYRDIHDDGKGMNDFALSCWERNLHNFIDNRFVFPERDASANGELYAMAQKTWNDVFAFDKDRSDERLHRIADGVAGMAKNLGDLGEAADATRSALSDAANGLRRLRAKRHDADFGGFERLFGRSQQYLSFVRRAEYP